MQKSKPVVNSILSFRYNSLLKTFIHLPLNANVNLTRESCKCINYNLNVLAGLFSFARTAWMISKKTNDKWFVFDFKNRFAGVVAYTLLFLFSFRAKVAAAPIKLLITSTHSFSIRRSQTLLHYNTMNGRYYYTYYNITINIYHSIVHGFSWTTGSVCLEKKKTTQIL